jgi:alpha-L-fucosidase
MLNISPRGDGSIPDEQQKILLSIGEWLKSNGEGIYDSRSWRVMGEGPGIPAECPPDWRGGSTADQTNAIKDGPGQRVQITEANFRFTTANANLYAFGFRYPSGGAATIKSLSNNSAKVERVTLLGPTPTPLTFTQTAEALVVTMPTTPPSTGMPYALRIEGSQGLGVS